MLDDTPFTTFMNHKPLTCTLGQVTDPWTVCQCRNLTYIAEYTSDIRYFSGMANIVADTLSRPLGHMVDPQRPGKAAHKTAAVKVLSCLQQLQPILPALQ
jgi:hypothetical protein